MLTSVSAETAWLAVLPCALLTVAAIVLLGPPLGRALLGPTPGTLLPAIPASPEAAEHGRYVFALLGPLLAAAVVLAIHRRSTRSHALAARIASAATQALVLAFGLLCVAAQTHLITLSGVNVETTRLFSPRTFAVAAALPLIVLGIPRRDRIVAILARAARETSSRRLACVVLAATLTALWLLTAVNSEDSLGIAKANNLITWDLNETFAVLDGRTPFVDFHAQYSQLWPYLSAAVMKLTSPSAIVWTIVMTAISGVALLSIYAVFRRIVGNSLLALALYAPFLATSFYMLQGPTGNRFAMTSIFSVWPMRYAGPYLLAWLTARHLDGAAPRRAQLLFLAAGLVALNNSEFGLGAFAATVVALACRTPPWPWRAAARLLADAAAGLLGAALLVTLLTLVRSGSLPHLQLLLEYPRLYGIEGWALEPMPTLGDHIAVYMTFAAAIVVAVARASGTRDQPVLTGMLAWSGVFGLIAASYYVGRSDYLNLAALFSAWCLALSLLLVVVVRRIAARTRHLPTAAEVAVLFGFGLTVCSLPQIPTPGPQLARLRNSDVPDLFKQLAITRFVAAHTRPGEHVVIIAPLSHRVAYDAGVVNVSAYSSIESMPAVEQLQHTLETVRDAGVHKAFIGIGSVPAEAFAIKEVTAAFVAAGFSPRTMAGGMTELSNAR